MGVEDDKGPTERLNDVVGVLVERREFNQRDLGKNSHHLGLAAHVDPPIFRALAGYRCPSYPLDLIGVRRHQEEQGSGSEMPGNEKGGPPPADTACQWSDQKRWARN